VGSHGRRWRRSCGRGCTPVRCRRFFHKLRKAQLRSGAQLAATNKHLEAAHHVEAALVAFFTRSFWAAQSTSAFSRYAGGAGAGASCCHLIRVEFNFGTGESPLVVCFEAAGGVDSGIDRGCRVTVQFSGGRSRGSLGRALIGLYKLSGVGSDLRAGSIVVSGGEPV